MRQRTVSMLIAVFFMVQSLPASAGFLPFEICIGVLKVLNGTHLDEQCREYGIDVNLPLDIKQKLLRKKQEDHRDRMGSG